MLLATFVLDCIQGYPRYSNVALKHSPKINEYGMDEILKAFVSELSELENNEGSK